MLPPILPPAAHVELKLSFGMTEALARAGATLSPPVVVPSARETSVMIPLATVSASCCVIVAVAWGPVELSEEQADDTRMTRGKKANARRAMRFMLVSSDARAW